MRSEYRLAIRRWGREHRYAKRDLEHASQGLVKAVDDLTYRQRSYVNSDPAAWIEAREVSEWRTVVDEEGR